MKKTINLLILISFLFLISCGKQISDPKDNPYREYEEALKIQTPTDNNYIVIKEWSLLLGGGADVFFEDSKGTQTFLGSTSGTDDGYRPFKDNKYKIDFSGNTVTITYYYGNKDVWKTNTFILP